MLLDETVMAAGTLQEVGLRNLAVSLLSTIRLNTTHHGTCIAACCRPARTHGLLRLLTRPPAARALSAAGCYDPCRRCRA